MKIAAYETLLVPSGSCADPNVSISVAARPTPPFEDTPELSLHGRDLHLVWPGRQGLLLPRIDERVQEEIRRCGTALLVEVDEHQKPIRCVQCKITVAHI